MKPQEFGRAFEVLLRKGLRWSGACFIAGAPLGTGLKKSECVCFQDRIEVTCLMLGMCLGARRGGAGGTFMEGNWVGETKSCS